jgi:hypothetical protein
MIQFALGTESSNVSPRQQVINIRAVSTMVAKCLEIRGLFAMLSRAFTCVNSHGAVCA